MFKHSLGISSNKKFVPPRRIESNQSKFQPLAKINANRSNLNLLSSDSCGKSPPLINQNDKISPIASNFSDKNTSITDNKSNNQQSKLSNITSNNDSDVTSNQQSLLKSSTCDSFFANNSEKSKPKDNTYYYYNVMYTQHTNKKHKVWSDGIAIIHGSICELLSSEGKSLIKRNFFRPIGVCDSGLPLFLGRLDIEILSPIPSEEFESGSCFISSSTISEPKLSTKSNNYTKINLPNIKHQLFNKDSKIISNIPIKSPISLESLPKHAIVLNRKECTNGREFPVVVDNYIGRNLKYHQKEGVQFIYRCLMGLQIKGYFGCILADEMAMIYKTIGLGKTLQAIALLWTLINTGPQGNPIVKKALIVTPCTLTGNWINEFLKWLGRERCFPVLISSELSRSQQSDLILDFVAARHKKVLLASYEIVRANSKTLEDHKLFDIFDIVIADEGHRLKSSSGNKTIRVLSKFSTRRKLILTGTPLQNDLDELYSMCSFVNTSILGSIITFRNAFSVPISLQSNEKCTKQEKMIGLQRSQLLSKLIGLFMLRRTNEVLVHLLPDRLEYILFCSLTLLQIQIYKDVLALQPSVILENNMANALISILLLRQICDHPMILIDKNSQQESERIVKSLQNIPPNYEPSLEDSGKLLLLDEILHTIKSQTDDRVVISANHTSTLDVIEKLIIIPKKYNFVRLDGSTPQSKRTSIVSLFNNPSTNLFIFLLTSKAGGVGLNLIGGNRMIIVDPDWNPSIDEQVMGRIWRCGQKKTVHIYRLVCAGTMEEKILQRQIHKQQYNIIMDDSKVIQQLPTKELRDIFKLSDTSKCDTHKLLGSGDLLKQWDFIDQKSNFKGYIDSVAEKVLENGRVIFSFFKYQDTSNDNINDFKSKKYSHSSSKISSPVTEAIREMIFSSQNEGITLSNSETLKNTSNENINSNNLLDNDMANWITSNSPILPRINSNSPYLNDISDGIKSKSPYLNDISDNDFECSPHLRKRRKTEKKYISDSD